MFIKQCGALILYCLPAIIALTVVINDYYNRASDVSVELRRYAVSFRELDGDKREALRNDFFQDNEVVQRLLHVFHRHQIMGTRAERTLEEEIKTKVLSIWGFQSSLIISFTLLPYVLLGSRLAFGHASKVDRETRLRAARGGFMVKLLLASVIALGWIYVLHPVGRGASLLHAYVMVEDVFSMSTLPIYIDAQNLLVPTMCGFLGWYLHLLTFFFHKFVDDDVMSTRVYGLLFRKYLFVYGIALVLSTLVTSAEGKAVMFLVGFFPLSAFSMLKQYFGQF